jgi:RNA polymerase sigma factor (sigma-70 family)
MLRGAAELSRVNLPAAFGNDPAMEAPTDAGLLARSAEQPELFGVVFDRHFATIHRFLERRAGREAADELAADVFRIAFERRAAFRPEHESALPWLYGLATRLLLKHWRRERRHLRAVARLAVVEPAAAGFDDLDDRLTARAARARLLEAVAGLHPRDRAVVLLVAWEGLSYDEVAVALDIPLGTVRSRLNRARLSLRELLDDIGNEAVMATYERREGLFDAG